MECRSMNGPGLSPRLGYDSRYHEMFTLVVNTLNLTNHTPSVPIWAQSEQSGREKTRSLPRLLDVLYSTVDNFVGFSGKIICHEGEDVIG